MCFNAKRQFVLLVNLAPSNTFTFSHLADAFIQSDLQLGVHKAINLEEANIQRKQWWSVTKYNYFVTVLKYIFQVSVLYWSSFILSNFYFYFTTFQSIKSYFLLHYIS